MFRANYHAFIGNRRTRSVLIGCVLALCGLVAPGQADGGYIFGGEYGLDEYVAVEGGTYRITGHGNLRQSIILSPKVATVLHPDPGTPGHVAELTPDYPGKRLFLLVGNRQAEKAFGYAVVGMRDIEFTHALRIDDMVLGSSHMAVDPAGRKIYLSYAENTSVRKHKFITRTYDSHTYHLIRKYSDTALSVFPPACFLPAQDLLFTNNGLFAVSTDAVVKRPVCPKARGPVSCSDNGNLLTLAMGDQHNLVLEVYQLPTGDLVHSIKTNIPFSSSREWHLRSDGKVIIRDEEKDVPVGGGVAIRHTGRLIFYDVQTGAVMTELQVVPQPAYNSRIIGWSSDGRFLFYPADKELTVVDAFEAKTVGRVSLPFVPGAVVWP